MKTYWEIPGPSKSPQSPCIAFYKYDGFNFRAEWSRKRGWYKFGTRRVMLDESSKQFGPSIPLFLNTYGDSLPKIFKSDKMFKGVQKFIVFCEVYSDNGFAGWFPQANGKLEPKFPTGEPAKIKLIDVNPHKKGIMLPRDFVNVFGDLGAKVVYEGNFSRQFIQDVQDGKIVHEGEGIVAKGVILGKKSNSQHGLWMAKAKTAWWMAKLKNLAQTNEEFRSALADNVREQSDA